MRTLNYFTLSDKKNVTPQQIFTGCLERSLQFLCNATLSRISKKAPPPGVAAWIDTLFARQPGLGQLVEFLQWADSLKPQPVPGLGEVLSLKDHNGVPFLKTMVNLRNQWIRPKSVTSEEAFENAQVIWTEFLQSPADGIFGKLYGVKGNTRWNGCGINAWVGDFIRIEGMGLHLVEAYDPHTGEVFWDARTLSMSKGKARDREEHVHLLVALRANDTEVETPAWADLAYKLRDEGFCLGVGFPEWFIQWSNSEKPGVLITEKPDKSVHSNKTLQTAFGKKIFCIRMKGTHIEEFDNKGAENPVPKALSYKLGYARPLTQEVIKSLTGNGRQLILHFSDFKPVNGKGGRILLKTIRFLWDIASPDVRFLIMLPEEEARQFSEIYGMRVPEGFGKILLTPGKEFSSFYTAFWGREKLDGIARILKLFKR